MSRPHVLVVGAGPTGLTLACGLRAHGVSVRVVDSATGPARTSRALGLQPRGREVLDRLGALGDLPARSLPVHRIVVHVEGRELATLRVGLPTPRVPRPGTVVSQAEVEGELRRRFAELGGTVEWGRELTTLDADRGGVRAAVGGEGGEGGEVMAASWVVGCDGAHSRVRKAAGIGFPGVPLAERFLLADVHAALPFDRDAVAVWLDGDDMLGAFPLPGTDRWRLMAPAPDPSAGTDPDDVASQLTDLLTLRSGMPREVVREATWTSAFRFHRRLADTYRAGRVLLAGDAAHIHSPLGGQGLNTGIGDAENLAWKLALVAGGRAGAELLDTYEAERRPVAQDVLASTTGVTRMVLGGSRTARLVRDRVFVPLLNRPFVQRLIWERSSQLLVSYRHGPLGGRGTARPRPGDRVPDLACRAADGGATRLHAHLGSGWALVATDDGLRERCGAVAQRWLGPVTRLVPAARSEALLVRPDGHLAWRGTDPAALHGHLSAVLHLRAPAPAPAGAR